MQGHTRNNHEDDAFNKVSRRYLIRNSSLAAAGMFIMPTFIPRCRKEDFPGHPGGGGGVGGEPPINYAAAAANLANLRAWIIDLYTLSVEYELIVLTALSSDTSNSDWKNFIVDIFIDIGAAIASAAALATVGPGAIPAIAFLSAVLHDWGIGKERPSNLDDVFTLFLDGHNAMQTAMEQRLSSLEDPGKDGKYDNLVAAWNQPIEFNGKNYTVGDLASSSFPTSNEGDAYNPLQTAAYLMFKKKVWNLVIMKCCTPYRDYYQLANTPSNEPHSLLTYMRQTYYPANKGQYVRAEIGYFGDQQITWRLYAYNLGINGNPFPDGAAHILFIDDTPGNVINPHGLFNRSYVFEQFSFTKPVFEYGDELGTNEIGNLNHSANDWDFTAGMFPYLAKIG